MLAAIRNIYIHTLRSTNYNILLIILTAKPVATKRKHDNGVDIENQASPPKIRATTTAVTKTAAGTKPKTVAATKPKAAAKERLNKCSNDFEQMNFSMEKDYNFKISTWNVAGLRALALKGGLDYVTYEKPDIFCIQVSKLK